MTLVVDEENGRFFIGFSFENVRFSFAKVKVRDEFDLLSMLIERILVQQREDASVLSMDKQLIDEDPSDIRNDRSKRMDEASNEFHCEKVSPFFVVLKV